MKNFVFISPNFPDNYWNFCHELKENGIRVLGIGDCPYDDLRPELKDSLHEYYKVGSLENYDEVFRAAAFFTWKYGKIDFLESNNEYWLDQDAALRTDFNIPGFHNKDIIPVRHKSKMKEYYTRAGIPVARYSMVETMEGAKNFIAEVGYPVIAKPDNGVGANDTWKINDEDKLNAFFAAKHPDVEYIMEEFIDGTVISYDAIIDSKGEPIFETGNVTPSSLVDVVNNNDNSVFYIRKELPDAVRDAGRRTVKSFGVKSRFVHFEFFRLNRNQYLGKKDDVVALEVNMRPSGGVTPDMINFAHSTNVFKIWADMIAYDSSLLSESGDHHFCAFCSRRDGKNFRLTHEQILERYAPVMKLHGRVPDAMSGAMANYMYLANLNTEEEVYEYYRIILEEC